VFFYFSVHVVSRKHISFVYNSSSLFVIQQQFAGKFKQGLALHRISLLGKQLHVILILFILKGESARENYTGPTLVSGVHILSRIMDSGNLFPVSLWAVQIGCITGSSFEKIKG